MHRTDLGDSEIRTDNSRSSAKDEKWTLPRKPALFIVMIVSTVLPGLLVLHSVWATRELREMRSIFLRDRAAAIAGRLEAALIDSPEGARLDALLEGEPSLLDVRLFRPGDAGFDLGPAASIRSGRELFHTEWSGDVFRAWVPVHGAQELRIVQIDLSSAAPDFILVHARHTVAITSVSGCLLVLVSAFAIWSMNRAALMERRQMETERLAQLGTLSAVLAHEIRNPLGAIKGFAQLARESAGEQGAKPLDAIVRESKRLEVLVNSLLLYGRPRKPVIRRMAWTAFGAELEAHAREMAGARRIRVSIEGAAEFDTDPDLLEQALLNLMRNAVEAIPDCAEGLIRVRADSSSGGRVAITVEDNGPGLPDEVRGRLFAPFVTTKASGTGLGLAISKKLVEALGGQLRFFPVHPHGTKAELAFHGTNSDH